MITTKQPTRPYDITESIPAPTEGGDPSVITLCGSTRFRNEFDRVNAAATLAGHMVLAPGVFIHAGNAPKVTPEQKARLDALHLRKIEAADCVIVIAPGGYVGESTAAEIAYAEKIGRTVLFHTPAVDKLGLAHMGARRA